MKKAGYYSIIVDESRDLAKQEQMSFVVRYFNVTDGMIQECFLSFVQAKCLPVYPSTLDSLSLNLTLT